MELKHQLLIYKILPAIFMLVVINACNRASVEKGMLLITVAPSAKGNPDYLSWDSWRFIQGARIIAFKPGNPESAIVLTKDFNSAAFPDISYDGRNMLFSAKVKQEDPWQIWEMNLYNLKARKITALSQNCTDPVYLPGGKIAFSRFTENDTVGVAYCIFTCNQDGGMLSQLTFSPDANFATTVLKDGRLLTVSRCLQPDGGIPMLLVMRPDGTKADMFYKSEQGSNLLSNACETNDGSILFIESDIKTGNSGRIISISYNRPLHTKKILSSSITGDFNYVYPITAGKYLASFRKSPSDVFALYEFDSEKNAVGSEVFSDEGYDVVDVVAAKGFNRPKKLPSEVDMQVKTGLLLCQDINFPYPAKATNASNMKAEKIEVLGIDTTYGVVSVEKDGSFYLKVMADKPFRIRTLDKNGNVINGPCSWIWLRPNERRGCVGCHEDPETTPDNKVSFAINKPPTVIPVHITDIKEKQVELE